MGDYISIYDIARAVEDGATVPIYYEGRLAKLELSEAERPKIEPDFARQLPRRYDRSISWKTATVGAWLPRIESAAAPA